MSKFTLVSFILWAIFLFVYVQCVDVEQVKSVAQMCKAETGASDADVEAMFKHELATSTESKCLRACTMKKTGMMNDDGTLKMESFMKFISAVSKTDEEKATYVEILEICASLDVAADQCEAAGEYQTCFTTKANEKGVAMPDV